MVDSKVRRRDTAKVEEEYIYITFTHQNDLTTTI
jgi:hypothetical protein